METECVVNYEITNHKHTYKEKLETNIAVLVKTRITHSFRNGVK